MELYNSKRVDVHDGKMGIPLEVYFKDRTFLYCRQNYLFRSRRPGRFELINECSHFAPVPAHSISRSRSFIEIASPASLARSCGAFRVEMPIGTNYHTGRPSLSSHAALWILQSHTVGFYSKRRNCAFGFAEIAV